MVQTALILGASGRFGRHTASAFRASGWRVRVFDRGAGDLRGAMDGADVVVNGLNPPDYTTWKHALPKIHRGVIDAARGLDLTIILPGNVYVFGADTPAPWSARSPHRAKNPLGQLRIDMEAAYRASGTRTILLRAGDFLDTEPSGNWFDRIITKPLCKGRIDYPGPTNVPHAWAYLPDLARAAVGLAMMRETLPTFADIPFAGYTLTGAEMAAHLGAKQGRPVRPARMAWWPLTIAAPFWPMLRGLQEMRYLWDVPHSLDDAALRAHLPGFEPTPVAHALMAAAALVDRHGPSPVGSAA